MTDEPRVERPDIPGYGIPEEIEGALPWSWARERLERATVYWVATVRPDGGPHLMPTWGAWVNDRFWMEGSPGTRRFRNLAGNPRTAVSIQDGRDTVIVEGIAEEAAGPVPELVMRLVAGFAKYRASDEYDADPANWAREGFWAVRPKIAFGWSAYPVDATRWRFAAGMTAGRARGEAAAHGPGEGDAGRNAS